MAALTVTNSFTAGTSIVASQMNTNFSDVVSWATGTPFLAASGQLTTVKGTLSVTELATFSNDIYLSGSNQRLIYEGASSDAYETYLAATDATADRAITFPDATGTVALIDNASAVISNSVFN